MLHHQKLDWHHLNENLCKSLFLACRRQLLSGIWPPICEMERYEKLWSDWLGMKRLKTAWFDISMRLFLFSFFFMALSLSFQKDMWFWMFCSYTLTLTLLCKSHLLRHLKVTFKRVTHSRGFVCHLPCIDPCNCRSMYSWLSFTHFNTHKHHIGTLTYT